MTPLGERLRSRPPQKGLIKTPEVTPAPIINEAMALAMIATNGEQAKLFADHKGVDSWDLTVGRGIVSHNKTPQEVMATVIRDDNHLFALRVSLAKRVEQNGDLDKAHALEQLDLLYHLKKGVNDKKGSVATWIEMKLYECLLSRHKFLTRAVIEHTKDQLAAIESGSLPDYRDSYEIAVALGYYPAYRNLLVKGIQEAVQVVQTHPTLFGDARINPQAKFSGVYANVVTGAGVVDDSDISHPESAAFTRAVFGAHGVRHHDTVDVILSALGHSAGNGLLQSTHADVIRRRFGPVIQWVDSQNRKNLSDQSRFGLRLRGIIEALQAVYGETDTMFSLNTQNGQPGTGIYNGFNRGDYILDPVQILAVEQNPDYRDCAEQILATQPNMNIPMDITTDELRKIGMNIFDAGRLAYLYAQLKPLEKALVLAALPEGLYKNIDYQAVLKGRSIKPEAFLLTVVKAIDQATS